ncbi:MAG: hypothetical protein WCZ90_03675 [Melioribacteraceae bacterium]
MKQKIFLLLIVLLFGGKTILPQSSGYSLGQTESLYSELAQAYTLQGKEMSKEEEDKLLKNLSAEVKEKLAEIKKLNKNKYFQLLREASHSYRFNGSWTLGPSLATGKSLNNYEETLKEQKEKAKKQAELEIDVELLALKYKDADSNAKEKIKNDLSGVLGVLFNIREEQKQEEVKRLEKRLQDLKESLQARKQVKGEIVQRRIQELLGDSKYLKWD